MPKRREADQHQRGPDPKGLVLDGIHRGNWTATPTLLATVGNVTSFTDRPTIGQYYSYWVTAVNGAGESVPSNRVWVLVR